MAVLHVMVIAGGGDANDNHHSHLEHVRGLTRLALERGVPEDQITIFWADGEDEGPDRAVVTTSPERPNWLVAGTPVGKATDPGPELRDTRFDFPIASSQP